MNVLSSIRPCSSVNQNFDNYPIGTLHWFTNSSINKYTYLYMSYRECTLTCWKSKLGGQEPSNNVKLNNHKTTLQYHHPCSAPTGYTTDCICSIAHDNVVVSLLYVTLVGTSTLADTLHHNPSIILVVKNNYLWRKHCNLKNASKSKQSKLPIPV